MSSLMRTIMAAVAAAFCFVSISNAQQGLNYETNYLVSTFAGDGTIAYRDGTGTNAAFYGAAFITSDAANNSYFLDVGYTVIRKISPEAVVTTLAGRIGRTGTNDGVGTNAQFTLVTSLAAAPDGTVYIADGTGVGAIRKLTPDRTVTTIAGSLHQGGYQDGPANSARFWGNMSLALDPAGALLILDPGNHRIRKLDTNGVVSTIAGTGAMGLDDGPTNSATFNNLEHIAVAPNGDIYVAEGGSSPATMIRRIRASDSMVETVLGVAAPSGAVDGAGRNARFAGIRSMAIERGTNLVVTDGGPRLVRRISLATLQSKTLAGSAEGYADGPGPQAQFRDSRGITVLRDGRIIVADTSNLRVRALTRTDAQAQLVAQMFLGMNVFGQIGSTWRIEHTPDLAQTNTWTPAGQITLSNNPTLWIDPTSNQATRRYYRAVLIE